MSHDQVMLLCSLIRYFVIALRQSQPSLCGLAHLTNNVDACPKTIAIRHV